MPFSISKRVDLSGFARHFALAGDEPSLALDGLATGVDNVRHDVALSPRFSATARLHLAKLIAKYGAITDIAAEPSLAPAAPIGQSRSETLPEFAPALADLLTGALQRAKADNVPAIDMLARLAVVKFLRAEMASQFNVLLERCRARVKSLETARNSTRAIELRERAAAFLLAKKTILRRVGQDLLTTLRDVDRDSIRSARRALLGDSVESAYELFSNPLLFTEDGRDDLLNAESYVMLGNYERDPDRFATMNEIAISFLQLLGFGEGDAIDHLLNVPSNAHELLGAGDPSDSHPKCKEQRTALAAWVDMLDREGVLGHVLAAYEAVALLSEYASAINPQQLKNALISRTELKRVQRVLEDRGRMSDASLLASVKRLGKLDSAERARIAGRFFGDFLRYHRDMRRLECLGSALDAVNVIGSDRLRELSAINNALYEFLLDSERKPAEEKVLNHVIVKADIRDSTLLTRTLFDRGLNPASYFSLNFYAPINKLIGKYGATKVFIEGDAVILALFEHEGEPALGVARACALAREMIDIVQAYNELSAKDNLPALELGIGITYQDSAPMYLVDGDSKIMISPAINESDRLSSCSKSARKMLAEIDSLFNVFCFQTIADADTAGQPEEFLMRFNIGGINLNAAAFRKLQGEIVLTSHDAPLPTLWEEGAVKLHSGSVPVGNGAARPIVVREARIPHIDAREFELLQWTSRSYFEVCTNALIYDYVEALAAQKTRGAAGTAS